MKLAEKKRSLVADLSLLLVAVIWGSGFVAVKNALNSVTPLYMMAMRFGIAFVLMSIVFWRNLKKINKNELIGGSVIGVFLFTAFAAQTIGLQYTTAGKQAFLTGTNVVMVPFLYWLINKKRPDKFSVIAAFLCFVGIGMLTLDNNLSINLGDSLTLLCALLFAFHIVSTGFFAENLNPIVLTIVQMGVATVLSVLSALIFEPTPQVLSSYGIFAVFYLGIFSTLICFLIQTTAQKYTTSTHAAIILSMESVFGSLLSVLLLGEKFTLKMFLGCVIILSAIITAETKWEFLKKSGKKEELDI